MKKISLIALMLFFGFAGMAQTEEMKEVKVPAVERDRPAEAEKGAEISKMATTVEGGKEKGVSISSAARRSSMVRNNPGADNAEKARERAALGADNAEKGKEISENARNRANAPAERPTPQNGRPAVVPASRPNAPVVRPNTPVRPTTPAPNRPSPPTRPTPPAGNPGGGL